MQEVEDMLPGSMCSINRLLQGHGFPTPSTYILVPTEGELCRAQLLQHDRVLQHQHPAVHNSWQQPANSPSTQLRQVYNGVPPTRQLSIMIPNGWFPDSS